MFPSKIPSKNFIGLRLIKRIEAANRLKMIHVHRRVSIRAKESVVNLAGPLSK